MSDATSSETPAPHRRRPRYAGKNPRRFAEKYKEHRGDAETAAKVEASGKTLAGTHRAIMVAEILEVLAPAPGEFAVDCTLGFGGHAREILPRLRAGGRLLGLDADPLELPRAETRMRQLGFGPDEFLVRHANFAGIAKALAGTDRDGADLVLADLGVSSMQLDDPARGFTLREDGPLDMRMNPFRGIAATDWLQRSSAARLEATLRDNADEPAAAILAPALAGRLCATTGALANAVRKALPRLDHEEQTDTIRRVFQAIRIAVNEEFSALEALLRALPGVLRPGGRVAILTFHSGEDRRVKKAFQAGLRDGIYAAVARDVIRASPAECRANSRATSAKLRWAIRAKATP